MEEAEALASKAVIVSIHMLPIGSLSSLQKLHGGLYKILPVKADGIIRSTAETQVRVTLKRWGIDVANYWDFNGLVQFNVVYGRTTLGKTHCGYGAFGWQKQYNQQSRNKRLFNRT